MNPTAAGAKAPAIALVVAAYSCALAAAVLVLWLLPVGVGPAGWPPAIFEAALADAVATAVVFAFSVGWRNSSLYDPYWSVAPPLLALYWWIQAGYPLDLPVVAMFGLVGLWSVRLTLNWLKGWQGLDHEDWRYRQLQAQTGVWYWPVSLLGIHFFPTLLVFLGCLPVYAVIMASEPPVGWLVRLSVLVGVAALLLETRADLELHRFRAHRRSAAEVLDAGVWRWCRHPNYLGEIGFWVALAGLALSVGAPVLWACGGALAMVGLFAGISIPMIERKLAADKAGYGDYQARVPMLLPYGRRVSGSK